MEQESKKPQLQLIKGEGYWTSKGWFTYQRDEKTDWIGIDAAHIKTAVELADSIVKYNQSATPEQHKTEFLHLLKQNNIPYVLEPELPEFMLEILEEARHVDLDEFTEEMSKNCH